MLHVPSPHLIAHYLVTAVTPTPSPTPSGGVSPSPGPTSTSVPIDPNKVQAGVLGLMFFLAMVVAVVLLAMSMRRHLGRVDVGKHQRAKGPGAPPPPALKG